MSENKPALEGGFRTGDEQRVAGRLQEVFEKSPDVWEQKFNNFPKYIRRQALTKALAQYEIFKRILNVKGSIVECGVLRGGSLFTWFHLSSIVEPVNFTRRIYGFDTFAGFPSVAPNDRSPSSDHVSTGALQADCYDELVELVKVHDSNRLLNHIDKLHLVRGDATKTIPAFVETHPHLVVSLLYLDFDLYEPTCAAIEHFVPRMPKGGIIAFDELDNPLWPGETRAAIDKLGLNKLRLERVEFDPYIAFAVVE
jgi:Macrocin-O-methyltransferase (TylF)